MELQKTNIVMLQKAKQHNTSYLPVRFTVTTSLTYPMRGVPPLPHMIVCTAKLHKVMELDIVKSKQFTEEPSVVLGHLPQFVDRML